MATIKTEVEHNEVVIPIDTPVGGKLLSHVQPGAEIDIHLGEWMDTFSENRGEVDRSITLEITHVAPDAPKPNISTGKLPRRILHHFPREILWDASDADDDDIVSDFLMIMSPGYLEVDIEGLRKLSGKEYLWTQAGELVPKGSVTNRSQSGGTASPERRFCTGCGEEVDDTAAEFCPYCGTEL